MNWQPVPYIIPLVVAAAISTIVALYCWRRRATTGARQFVLLMLAVSVWSLSYALELSSADLSAKIFWSKIEYLGIVTIPTMWLIFALWYTGREKWLTSRNRVLLAIQPIITLLLAWTNEGHSLIWQEIALDTEGSFATLDITHGVFFWLHVVYAYGLLVLGTFLVVRTLVRSTRLYRRQVAILLTGLLAPWVGNALYISPINPFPNLDLTPFGYTLSGLAVTWGLFRFRLLDIVPVARDAVVTNMPDGVIVLDVENRIVDLNPAAQRIIGRREEEAIGQPAVLVVTGRSDLVEHFRSMSQARGEIVLGGGESQGTYDLDTSRLLDRRGRLTGWLVMLHDVTERKQTEQALKTQKQLFENLVTVARATSEHPTLQTTLKNVLNVASTLTEAELSSLCLLDETGVVTDAILAHGEKESAQQRVVIGRALGDALAGRVVQHRQSVLVRDATDDDRPLISADESYAARSALIVPIIRGQVVLGVLTLAHSAPDHFSDEHQRLMEAAADQMALALHNAQIYEAQRRLANRQATLYEVLRTVGAYLDSETVARVAVRVVARMTNWPAVALLLPDDSETDEAPRLVPRATAGALAPTDEWDISPGQGVIGRAFRTKETQYVPDVSADPDYVGADPAVCSEMAVPLRRGARVLGVLNVESDRVAAFDAEDVLLAESLAEAIALALDNARLHTEMTRHADDLAGLYTIAHIVSQSLVLEDTLSEALSAILASLDFDVGLVSLVHPADGHLYLAAEEGLPHVFRDQFRQKGMGGTLCAYVHNSRRNVLTIGDIEQDTPAVVKARKEAPMVIDGMRALAMRSYVGIPLLYQEQSLGTLSLFARKPRVFSLKALAQQMAVGQQIAAAVANARLFQSIADEHSRLQALIETSRDGIILIGMDLRVLVMNATALGFLGLAGQPEDWIGRPLQDALGQLRRHAPTVVRATLAEMRRIQKGDEPVGEGEYEVSAHKIHWLNLPVISDGMPLGRLLVLHDVTQERLLESMRDDLTRTMVHDLRNPLTSISVSLELLDHLLADAISSSQRQMLDVAQQNTKRMLGLVGAILDISRLEGGQMPLAKAPLSVRDLVAAVVESQLPLIAEKGLYLRNDVLSGLPAAYADGTLVERVLQNLVGNAIKFTPTGGEIRVTAEVDGTVESKLFISVSDTGPGISPEIRNRLFQKFVTGQQEERGSGLGLAFCRMVVEAHGERIWVESAPGEGATFTFTLPLSTEKV
jgi:PAS domain S-box-containing protein